MKGGFKMITGKRRNWVKFLVKGITENIKKLLDASEVYMSEEEFFTLSEIYGQLVKLLNNWRDK